MTYWLAFTFKKVTDIIEWLVIFLSQWWEGQLTVAVLWPIDWLTHWLYYPGTAQLTEWFMADWLTDCLTDSTFKLNCPGTDHLTEWFIANWIVGELANWLNDLWLIKLSGNWPTDRLIYGYCNWIDWELANWLNDPRLIELFRDWPSDWMICGWLNWPGTDQLTEWFIADCLTE